MLRYIMQKLEDPDRPLLGPNYKALTFWGLLLPKNINKRIFYLTMHFLVTIFTATEYVDIWFVKEDMNMLLNNIKITLLATVSVSKVLTFLSWQKYWKSIIEYINSADLAQRNVNDATKSEIIKGYTKYCRKITYLYWTLMYTTVIIVMGQPVYRYFSSEKYRENVKNGTESYIQVVSSWVPFNKNTLIGHVGASIYQSFSAIYGGGWITSFDTNAIVIMVFFKAELEMLRIDCRNIFKGNVDDATAIERLKSCHKRHVEIIANAAVFDSCLSPIMFLYMFVCSVMLCATAYQITVETNPMQQFLIAEYLIFGIAQLFMYCWHSNDVFYASKNLMLGPYESEWWSRRTNQQKDICILIDQFNKSIVFTAGPFNNLTVSTFINILKGAYSYYTLLS